jgi:hypothetical protein
MTFNNIKYFEFISLFIEIDYNLWVKENKKVICACLSIASYYLSSIVTSYSFVYFTFE